MTDDPIPSLAEALTEIRAKFGDDALEVLRLRAADLTAFEEIRRLRARIAELEGSLAITFGTLEQPTPDWPTTIEHNIPPNAPPHNEQPPIGHTIKWPSPIGNDDE